MPWGCEGHGQAFAAAIARGRPESRSLTLRVGMSTNPTRQRGTLVGSSAPREAVLPRRRLPLTHILDSAYISPESRIDTKLGVGRFSSSAAAFTLRTNEHKGLF